MRVIIGCERSGIVRDAFIALGHDAVSCDLAPTERPGPHIQDTILSADIWKQHWDLGIFHPDCTFLTVSGARWMSVEWREEAQLAALHFVKALWKLPIERIAIENPVGKLSSLWRGPDQIIQPYQFGDPFKKTTCLWLKNLPKLEPTNNLGTGEQACWKEAPGPERKMNRARTYPGIASAFAEQWGECEFPMPPCTNEIASGVEGAHEGTTADKSGSREPEKLWCPECCTESGKTEYGDCTNSFHKSGAESSLSSPPPTSDSSTPTIPAPLSTQPDTTTEKI